jgi:hypothetical protein
MTSTRSDPWAGKPLLDIVSLARRGPGRRDAWTRGEADLVQRTLRGSPEVMVKVLSQGATDAKAVAKHLAYLSRRGELEIETDDGEQVQGKKAEKEVMEDWEIGTSGNRRYIDRRSATTGKAPRLVHKLIFSMPSGTPPQKVLQAVQTLAREEFALTHRYAMVLHTDQPHPHVHLVVKALGENGKRLNIKKPMLRRLRHEFARNLRELGVDANATERGARGKAGRALRSGAFRLAERGELRVNQSRDAVNAPPPALASAWRQVRAALERLDSSRTPASREREVGPERDRQTNSGSLTEKLKSPERER